MNVKRPIVLTVISATIALTSSAQSFYDDIYYNPDKDKKAEKVDKNQQNRRSATTVNVYPAADTYIVTSGSSTRSIDDYNRRGFFAIDSTKAVADSVSMPDFAYTRRVEAFHNPNIIVASDDADLVNMYYSDPVDVNIIINSPAYTGWYSPYYSSWWSPWGWNNAYWGPSWAWGWNTGWWGPSWGWSWGWNTGWWGPSWGWDYGWGVPSWGWSRPSYRHPGAVTRPGGNLRPGAVAGNQYRPGSTRHPGSGARPNYNNVSRPGSVGNYRPGSGTVNRPSGNSYRPGSSRPSYNGNNNSGSRPSYNGNSNSSRPSYNYNSGGSGSRHSGGSYNRGGGGFGGGSRGGGGGSRGGRH